MKKVLALLTVLVAVAVFFSLRKSAPESVVTKADKKAGVIPAPLPLPMKAAEAPRKVEPPPVEKPRTDPMPALFEKMLKALEKCDGDKLRELAIEIVNLNAPKNVAPDKNGALVFLAGFEKMTKFTDEEREAMAAIKAGTATSVQASLVEALIARNAEAFEIFRKAATYPEFQYPVTYEDGYNALLPHIPFLRDAAELVEFEGIFKKARGEDDSASRALMGRMGDSLSDEPLMVSQLIRDSIVERTGLGESGSIRPVYRQVMMMEFAASIGFGLSQIDESMLALPEFQAMGRHYVEVMREGSELLQLPWLESRDRIQALANRIISGGIEAEGSRQLAPSFGSVANAIARAEAALGPAVDPFTGRAMLTRNGVTYSVGPDGVDNGGDPKLDVPVRRR